jgi:hypothetical protein
MPILEKNFTTTFSQLRKGVPFSVELSIYSLTEGKEIVRKHILYKQSDNKAITTDKRVVVHFLPESSVTECYIEQRVQKKSNNVKQGGHRQKRQKIA